MEGGGTEGGVTGEAAGARQGGILAMAINTSRGDKMELTDQEKSVKLARAMGWHVIADEHRNRHGTFMIFHTGSDEPLYSTAIIATVKEPDFFNHYCPNLYEPQNMSLAWRVLNWAADRQDILDSCMEDGFMEDIRDWWELPASEAQRLWLDRVLNEIEIRGDEEE